MKAKKDYSHVRTTKLQDMLLEIRWEIERREKEMKECVGPNPFGDLTRLEKLAKIAKDALPKEYK